MHRSVPLCERLPLADLRDGGIAAQAGRAGDPADGLEPFDRGVTMMNVQGGVA